MTFIIALTAALAPLALLPGVCFYYDTTPKVVIILAASALLLPWTKRGGTSVLTLVNSRLGRWFLLCVAGTAVILCLATLFSAAPALSLAGSTWRRFGLLTQAAILIIGFATAAWVAHSPGALSPILRAIVLAGAVASAYGVAQYFGLDPLLDPSAYHIGEGERAIVRPPGTLGHAGYAATYYLSIFYFGLALGLTDRTRLWRWLGWFALGCAGFAILLSGTRSALLGLGCGAAVLGFWWRPRLTRQRLGALAAVVAAVTLFILSPAGERLRARVLWALEEPTGGARPQLWVDSLRMATAKPVTGWGPESFVREFPRYQSLELARLFPDFYHESPHNILLDALVSTGLPGLAALIGLTLCGLVAGWRVRLQPVVAALTAALIATAVSQQFIVFTAPTALYYFLTIGLLVGMASRSRAPVTFQPRRLRILRVASFLLALPLVGWAVWVQLADADLASVQRLLDQQNVRAAAAAYERAESRAIPGPGAALWYSRRMGRIAASGGSPADRAFAFRRALAAARRAPLSAENRANAYYSLASFRATAGDFPNTEKNLRAAIAAAPNWFKPHWALARALQLAGRHEEARREADAAVRCNAGKDPEVAATLKRILHSTR